MVQVVQGFSLTNRCLLYASCTLAPAQLVSGIGNDWPSNIGFLAYNMYTQVAWYFASKDKQLHALSMVVPHFTLIWALTYQGGVTSGNLYMGAILGLGTAGVIILNAIASWESVLTNQIEGFGVYQFFFYGWRTLTPQWHTFFVIWEAFNTLEATTLLILALSLSVTITLRIKEDGENPVPWWATYAMIPLGAAVVMLFLWILILWTELIVARNQIESDTDWIAVWLFVAQVLAMLVPPPTVFMKGGRKGTQSLSKLWLLIRK